MKKLFILLFACLCAIPAAAQSGKIIKPALKAAAGKTIPSAAPEISLQQAQAAYLQAARNYNRFTPPLVSSDYVLAQGKKLQLQSGALHRQLARWMNQRIRSLEELKAKKEEALLIYGQALAQNHGWTDTARNMPSPLPDMFPRYIEGTPMELPFEKYVRALTAKTGNVKALGTLQTEQQAIAAFLQKDLKETSQELFSRVSDPDPLGEIIPLSFATANRLVQLTQFMLRHPNAFQPQLFELNVRVAQAPKTPFNDYLCTLLQKDPNYPTYYAWLRAEKTGINFTPFQRMYNILSGGK